MKTDPSPYLVQNYGRFARRFVRGEGCWLYDDEGRAYLDCLSGIAVNALGHGHPALVAAIREQAGQLLHTSNLFHIAPQEALAERLCRNSFADRVYFCNSGTEANECAVKIARLWGNQVHGGRKPRLIAAENSFHGRTIGALSLTGTEAYRAPFAPLLDVTFVPYGDETALAAAMGDDVAALFLEPLQGEGGVRPAPAGYLAAARTLCDRHASLLVLDEVQTGIGRCGRFLCHEYDGVKPDVVSLAKGLGGGVPIGASLMSETCAELLKPGTHASTFGGNHLACAAGGAVVDEVLKPGFLDHVNVMGECLRSGLRDCFGDRALDIRGRGLLIGVQLAQAPGELLKACLAEGLVCGSAGGQVLRLAPPLVIAEAEVEELLARLARALASLG
jgi:predicted acetylornithine/succinylornithine family transaminase